MTPSSPSRPLRNIIDVLIMLAALVLVLLGTRFFGLGTETGGAHIIDGDSLRLDKDDIRLFGIDAPEYHQECEDESRRPWPCGKQAAEVLSALSRGQAITCVTMDSDRYGRNVATCRTPSAELNREMVRLGWAVAYRQHSLAYAGEENDARSSKRGIWRGRFEEPQHWRQRQRSMRGALGGDMGDE
ncbi:hypothetical protein BH10PSE7_BH10PSE7_05330 [soil metagenome]